VTRFASRLPALFVAGAVAAGTAAGVVSCGGSAPPPRAVPAHAEAHWEDLFDTMPELLVVVRPRALRQDKVYGPLLSRAIELAREQSPVVAATRALDAMEDAETVIVGVRSDTPERPGELVLVERGVRADIDPEKLVDADGRALWTPGPQGSVRELVRDRDEHGHALDASLFELPGRTWVVASGDARTRARDAFAHPIGRPAMALDPDALFVVRVDGASLVAHFKILQDLGSLAAVGRKLQSLTLLLPPGNETVLKATFAYGTEDAAAFAEVTLREAAAQLGHDKRVNYGWLASAKVERPDKRVVVTTPLPPQLVDGLLHAGTAPLGPVPSPPAPAVPPP
jgi:hypothetical protein